MLKERGWTITSREAPRLDQPAVLTLQHASGAVVKATTKQVTKFLSFDTNDLQGVIDSKKRLPESQQTLVESIREILADRPPSQVVNHINPPKIDATILNVDLSSMPPPVVNVAAPEVTVNVPQQPAPQITVTPEVSVNVPEPAEFDIEAERDAAGLVKRFKRIRKQKG